MPVMSCLLVTGLERQREEPDVLVMLLAGVNRHGQSGGLRDEWSALASLVCKRHYGGRVCGCCSMASGSWGSPAPKRQRAAEGTDQGPGRHRGDQDAAESQPARLGAVRVGDQFEFAGLRPAGAPGWSGLKICKWLCIAAEEDDDFVDAMESLNAQRILDYQQSLIDNDD
jgi:hypothetical protein